MSVAALAVSRSRQSRARVRVALVRDHPDLALLAVCRLAIAVPVFVASESPIPVLGVAARSIARVDLHHHLSCFADVEVIVAIAMTLAMVRLPVEFGAQFVPISAAE